ncbi:MAG: hypothetical protein HKN23_01570 [Verrucomicrobiales bacterium]|nr:hypothetical protein [Verrucomicrobiales bacterium]
MKTIQLLSTILAGIAFLAVPGLQAQDKGTSETNRAVEKATEAGRELLKNSDKVLKDNPQLQNILNSVKDDPGAVVKEVSPMAREQLNKIQGNSTNSGGVPATRSAVPNPAPATPTTGTTPQNPTAANPNAMLPEPVARGTRPAPLPPTAAPPTTTAPAPTLNGGVVPPPRDLKPQYDPSKSANKGQPAAASGGANGETMEITSDETSMNQETGFLVFKGNVYLVHPAYNMTCDQLEIYMFREDENPPRKADGSTPEFKKAVATGGMVEIERIGAQGQKEIAKARRADFNPVLDEIILSGGPPTMQSGGRVIDPNDPRARIILNNRTKLYKVEGGRHTLSIPMGKKAPSSGGGLPTNLNSISDRNKKDR